MTSALEVALRSAHNTMAANVSSHPVNGAINNQVSVRFVRRAIVGKGTHASERALANGVHPHLIRRCAAHFRQMGRVSPGFGASTA